MKKNLTANLVDTLQCGYHKGKQEGLLNPVREENGYREYSEEDVVLLMYRANNRGRRV